MISVIFHTFPAFLIGVSVTQSAPHPSRVIQSRGSVCAEQEWRAGCATRAARASLDSRHEVAEVQDFTPGITSCTLCHPSNPLIHLLIQITHEAIFRCLPRLPSPPAVLCQPVTATPWAPSPCSVTATAPVTVARASWVISVTNVS